MLKCEEDFGIRRTAFERIISGIKRPGGHGYKDSRQRVLMRNPQVLPDRRGEGKAPWTKDQQVWYLVWSTSGKFCKKVCTSESGLTNHIK